MKEIDILENKLTNLIPIVNPALNNEEGIRAAILYRISQHIEVDSSDMVKETYKRIYGKNIPESADTIFNAFIPFLDFCRAKLILLKYNLPKNQKELLKLILIHLDEIFDGYVQYRLLLISKDKKIGEFRAYLFVFHTLTYLIRLGWKGYIWKSISHMYKGKC